MSAETDFLCTSVSGHAARVRELLAEIKSAPFDSPAFYDAYGALITRAEYLANRADELAALCKKEGTTP